MGTDNGIELLLKRDGLISVADFKAAWPDMPMASVYSRIRALLHSGRISQAGRGQYLAIHKPGYSVPVTDWMVKVNNYLINVCEGVNTCITQTDGNLFIEVAKADIDSVYNHLKEFSPKVVLQKEAKRFPAVLEGYIILGHLVSDAPVDVIGNLSIPCLEKQLVDTICNNTENHLDFQKVIEVYPVNINRMIRYASRRGVSEELSALMTSLNQDRIKMIGTTQKYLSTIPVRRAWVFGSFARGEETPGSDLDLLVEYTNSGELSLLDVIKFKRGLEKQLGREVDLVENGFLKPFAIPSAERDKYLIYER